MRRISIVSIRSHALCAALLLAASPVVAARHLPGPATAVRWLEPAAGAELRAGERAVFAWEPGPEFAALGAVEEWELFLSYDDGASWPVRLTPHLGIDHRRFEVDLPGLPSERARFLLRIGDERLEYEIELAGRWQIERGRRDARARDLVGAERLDPNARRGESARDGAPGVALWLDGSRAGEGLRWRVYEPRRSAVESSRLLAGTVSHLFGVPPRARVELDAGRASSSPFAGRPASVALAPAVLLRAGIPLLLLTCRRNE